MEKESASKPFEFSLKINIFDFNGLYLNILICKYSLD